MSNYKPAIVVVAYNRSKSLKRLLSSLEVANYSEKDIQLIISIDHAQNNKDVLEVANNFSWQHGKKEIRYQEKNLGLRKHVLQCGDLSEVYGSIIMLEDDLYVSPNFYDYTCQALEFTETNESIGGISLYKHEINMCTYKSFTPIEDGYDNWYFQYAASWGQAWSSSQWHGFRNWYNKGQNLKGNINIPRYVRAWSDKSWLKYNIAYLIDKNMFFMYPKIALTTNFSDVGTHVGHTSTAYQVPLLFDKNKKYKFSSLKSSQAVYDAFYENTKLYRILNKTKSDLVVDLYGHKEEQNKKYLLTNKVLDYKIISSYGRLLKPIETNILLGIPGNELYLYDTDEKEINKNKFNNLNTIFYSIKYISLKDSYQVYKYMKINRIKYLIRKIISLLKK